ncbi:ABC transporter permease [Microbacterium lushaniae]|uniref:ABC transporter permease n=1 Tax=Microbacterium lushaniae TaxID=2614639 RepID=A0A5J6L1D4_9MICO|nr:ABC transporter permease [Microbacterium lushaniae]QEW02271.1 ABC transporter permease [Microbacterium lushaniae]
MTAPTQSFTPDPESLGSVHGHAAALVDYDRNDDRRRFRRERRIGVFEGALTTLGTIAVALLLCFLILLATGKDAVGAYEWLLSGPVSRPTRFGRVLLETTTLSIVALSVAAAFRAGLMTLGAEGQLYMGALAATVVALFVPLPPGWAVIVPLLSAMTVGMLCAALPAWMKAALGANELVATLMLNAVLVRLYSFVLTNWLTPEGATSVASEYLPSEALIPALTAVFGVNLDNANLMMFFIPVLAVAVWVLLNRTPLGYSVRMSGSNALFGLFGGIAPRRVIVWCFLIGGAIAGLAGAHIVQGVSERALLTLSAGVAFDGIMVAILARANPLLIPIAAFFYAYLKVGGLVMEQEMSIGTEIVSVIQALVVLMASAQILLVLVRRRRAASAGKELAK